MPLKFAAQNLAFSDTVAWTLQESEYEALKSATLWLKGETMFPFETRLLVEMLDGSGQVLDTLIQNVVVPAGQLNPNTGQVEQAMAFNQSVELTEARLQVLKQTEFFKLRAFFNTPPGGNVVSMKSQINGNGIRVHQIKIILMHFLGYQKIKLFGAAIILNYHLHNILQYGIRAKPCTIGILPSVNTLGFQKVAQEYIS